MGGWYVGTHKLQLPHPNRSSIKLLQGHDKAKPKSLWDAVVLTTSSNHHDKKVKQGKHTHTHQQSIQSKLIHGYLGVVGSTGSYRNGIYVHIFKRQQRRTAWRI